MSWYSAPSAYNTSCRYCGADLEMICASQAASAVRGLSQWEKLKKQQPGRGQGLTAGG